MEGPRRASIRTPDQRLRVFVSSTLKELAPERRAVRAAIERLRLAPVMFELGARPHPPRELYRAYLDQSDVFVGIYGDSYGWIAPEEEISGLEDEYRLTPREMPKLIYVRRSESRDERLSRLIARIQDDDTAAYLPFTAAEDLEEQVASDLATLLAERFDGSRPSDPATAAAIATHLPVPYTSTIGRDRELAAVRDMLSAPDARLVSLVGPGGIGKSRLAIEVAHAAGGDFPDGVHFVPLEGVLEPDLLLPTIAYALGVRDNGEASLEERIGLALADRRALLVLDNFEQLLDSAPALVRLYALAPRARFLVTSRVVLRIRGERVFDVGPLAAPDAPSPSLARAQDSPAVALFVERARAVDPGFTLTPANAADVAEICSRLEGLPLAIELAAATVRTLPPAAIAARLERSLPLLAGAARDVPDRHRTMTSAIDWSVHLLPDAQRALLEDLGVFARRFTLDAVAAVSAGRPWEGRELEALSGLVDASLVRRIEIGGRSAYSLLSVVREYALARLKDRGGAEAMRAAHADHYLALVGWLAPGLRGAGQADAVARLGLELPNLRAAIRHLIYIERVDDAGRFAWCLLIYWWIAGFFAEVRVWMLELLGDDRPLSAHTRAVAWFFALWGKMWQRPSPEVVAGLAECLRLFTDAGDEDAAAMALAARATARLQLPEPDLDTASNELEEAVSRLRVTRNRWAEAITEVSLGRLAWLRGDAEGALGHFHRATDVAESGEDLFTVSVAGDHLARVQLLRGEIDAAEGRSVRTLGVSIRLHYEEGVAYGLEGLCAVAAARGEAERAGMLAGAAGSIRRRIGVFDVEPFTVYAPQLDAARAVFPDEVARGEERGRTLTVAEAVAAALPGPEHAEVAEILERW